MTGSEPGREWTRRRVLSVGGLGGAALLAAACGSGGGGGGGGAGGDVAFVNKSLEIFFYQVLLKSITRAVQQADRKLVTTNANNDSGTQFNDWKSTLLKKPEFIISNPVDSENLVPLTAQSKAKKIPVGVIDTPLTRGDVAFTIAFDNLRGGVMAAESTVAALKKRHGSAKGIVLDIYGTLESSALRERRDGFDGTIRKYPGIKLLSRPTEQSLDKAKGIVEATLKQYPDLDAVHSPTDSLTRPAMTAMRAAGKLVPIGRPGHIILTSIDGGPESLGWLRERTLDAEIAQDPVAYGQICVEMLTKYAVKGRPVPLAEYVDKSYFWERAPVVKGKAGPQMVLPPYAITEANADDPRQWGNVVTKQWGMKES